MPSLSGLRAKVTLYAPPVASLLAGALIGVVAWSGHVLTIPVSLLFCLGLRFTPGPLARFLLCTGYFAGGTWMMLPGAAVFYGTDFNPGGIFWMWVGFSVLMALPWAVLCGRRRLVWAIPLCFVLTSVPPLALASIVNPLTSAGVLLPTTSWFGIVAIIGLGVVIATRPRYGVPAWAALLLLACLTYHPAAAPQSWQGINTTFGGSGINLPDPLTEYKNAQIIQRTALQSHAQVIVFPETSIHRWNSTTDLFWGPQLHQLQTQGKTLLIGADVSIPASTAYKNVVVVRGSSGPTLFQQRVPIPVAMWKPGATDGVPLNLNGPGVLQIGRERAAVLICYEQLLTWPVLTSMTQHPTVIVGVANDYWAKDTIIPAIQNSCLEAWARLFRLPLVKAVNV
jgi:Carbon-nitrogen hydrolase